MCRLCGFTFTSHEEYKNRWLDRILLVSQTDENQSDGWGVTDGIDMWKSEHMYSACVPIWYKDIRPSLSWMSHVRKASTGTGRTLLEAHPYRFDLTIRGDGYQELQQIYCAHNGKIDGTTWKQSAETPNTDSYRAFLALATIMSDDGHTDLTADLFSQWLSDFTDTSQLAMLFHYKRHITALRKERPLHYARLGDGYVIHTSKEVLEVFRRYIRGIDGVESGDIIEVPKDHMVFFPTGSEDITQVPVDIKMRTYWSNNHSKNAVTSTVPADPPPPTTKENTSGAITHAPSVTRPKKEKSGAATSEIVITDKGRVSVMQDIINYLSPLRQNLIWLWANYELGYTPTTYVSNISAQDLCIWRGMLPQQAFTKAGSDVVYRAYTSRQYVLINQWNHVIKRGKDSLLQNTWLGDIMFWLLPRYLKIESDMAAQQLLVSDIARFTSNNDLFECWSLSTSILEQAKDGDFDISELQQ